MIKHYIRISDAVDVGPHGIRQIGCVELDDDLVGRAVKIIDSPVLDPEGNPQMDLDGNPVTVKKAVLDEDAEALRLIAESEAEEQAKHDSMRAKRDRLLQETDFIMMPDYPIPNKSATADYRQALRDLPDSISDINSIDWPVKP